MDRRLLILLILLNFLSFVLQAQSGRSPVALHKSIAGEVIGYTYFDQPTKGAVSNHLIRFSDGTMMIGIMASKEGGSTPSRGSYYQYFNGTKWLDTSLAWVRVEGSKRGYTTMAAFAKSKKAIIVSHPGITLSINTGTPESPAWKESVIPGTAEWSFPDVAADDMNGTAQNIYVTAGLTIDTAKTVFIRSTDGGQSWGSIKVLSDMNSYAGRHDYLGNVANDYHIAAGKGKVALLNFKTKGNVVLYLSDDQGQTFTSKTLYDLVKIDTALQSIPFDTSFFPAKKYKALGIPAPDGSGDVLIDSLGVVHCAWGTRELYYYIKCDIQGKPVRDAQGRLQRDFAYSDYSPNTGIYYWRSDWDNKQPVLAAKPNVNMISEDLTDTSGVVPLLIDRATDGALLTMPSVAVNAVGEVYIFMQGFKKRDIQTVNDWRGAYGHVYGVRSSNGGQNFNTNPEDILYSSGEDVTFPVVADDISSGIFMLMLNDPDAGSYVLNGQPGGPHGFNRAAYLFKAIQLTDVDEDNHPAGKTYRLDQNYPNPFNPSTKITYSLAKNSAVTLKVYDLLGREVAVPVNSDMPAGEHTAYFNAAELSAGVYIYTLNAGSYTSSRKMLLIK